MFRSAPSVSRFYWLILVVTPLLWLLASAAGLLRGLEQEALQLRYLARGEQASSAPVAFVDVDAESVSEMGERPWDRGLFADAARALIEAGGARVVVVDFVFSQFGFSNLVRLSDAIDGEIRLGELVADYPDRVILAAAYSGVRLRYLDDEVATLPLIRNGFVDPLHCPFPEAPTYPILRWDRGRLGLADMDEGLNQGAVPYFAPAFVRTAGPRFSIHLLNGWHRNISRSGLAADIVADDTSYSLVLDNGYRHHSLPRYSEQLFLSLGIEAYLAANGLDGADIRIADDRLEIAAGDPALARTLPLHAGQSVEVNWLAGWDPAGEDHASLIEVSRRWDALRGGGADEGGDAEWFRQFEDKVIFIGPVDSMLKDIAPTPFNGKPVPKVGFHANLYRTIEDASFIRRTGRVAGLALTYLLTVAVATWLVSGRKTGVLAKLLPLVAMVAYVVAVIVAFSRFGWVLPLVAPVGSALSASMLVLLVRVSSEEFQRRRINQLFSAYVSPAVVNRMVDANEDPQLGGVSANVTALFSDVQGFSAISEELEPERLVSLMNEYLTAMTEVIQSEEGTLDKYIGDAVVAMFGAPIAVDDHAARACRAAIAMQRRNEELREQWAVDGRWPGVVRQTRTRIGINTGRAIIGNMGSRIRFNYTMMGDSVNLSARCESGAKSYGVYTLVTGATRDAALMAEPALEFRPLDRIIVKGRSRPVDVFELWCMRRDLSPEMRRCRDLYAAALEAYFAGRWQDALDGFREAAPFEPLDPATVAGVATTPSAVMADRCREFIANGGPEDWQGVYRMTTK